MERFNKISKVCIILSLLMPFLSLIIGRYLNNDFELFFNALILYLLVPCTMCGAWMWFSHNAGRYVNGFDNISIEKRNRFANYFGIYLIISMILISISVGLFTIAESIPGILILIVSILVLLYPMRYLNDKIVDKKIVFENASDRVKIITCAIVSILVTIPILVADNCSSSVAVDVTFGEEEFSVRAPMFDYTFSYSDVEEVRLDSDFDRGIRVYGFGTSVISSGLFKNDQFGRYHLASYTKISSCIVFSVNGDMYAFNQDSEESTKAAFDTLQDYVNRL